jgi:hypothetical protein
MYPISQQQSGEFDSQSLQYHQQFTDATSLHIAPTSDYDNSARRHSVHTYSLAEDPSITLNYSYPPIHDQSYDYSDTQTQIHLHAPVPVPVPYGPPHVANSSRQITPPYVDQTYYDQHVPYPPSLNQAPPPTTTANTDILDYYANAPQLLFPTPSELLTDLSTPSAPISATLSSSLSHPTQREQSQSSERSNETPASAAPNTSKTESQRKARQRAVAEEIGFIPTDP